MNPRRVTVIGLWVDDPPLGTPNRFAHLPELGARHGLGWQIVHHTVLDVDDLVREPPAGILLTGSRYCLGEDCSLSTFPTLLHVLAALPMVPVLGICFGHQFLNRLGGGELDRLPAYRDDNDFSVDLGAHPLFAVLPSPCPLAENHGQRVSRPGRDWRVIATSADGIEATAHAVLPRLSVQFHPEYYPRQKVGHGQKILESWLKSL